MGYEELVWSLGIALLPTIRDLLFIYLIFDFLRSLLFNKERV